MSSKYDEIEEIQGDLEPEVRSCDADAAPTASIAQGRRRFVLQLSTNCPSIPVDHARGRGERREFQATDGD
jgi:hypothetical protein